MLNRILLYVRDPAASVAFYTRHFGYAASQIEGDRTIALTHASGGASLMLHPAGKGQKRGQVLVFEVADIPAFIESAAQNGLIFGPVHKADEYTFSNAKDPDLNSIQRSSRGIGQ